MQKDYQWIMPSCRIHLRSALDGMLQISRICSIPCHSKTTITSLNPFVDSCFFCGFSEQYSDAEKIRMDQAVLQNPSKNSFRRNTRSEKYAVFQIIRVTIHLAVVFIFRWNTADTRISILS